MKEGIESFRSNRIFRAKVLPRYLTRVTKMQTAPILLGFIIARAKRDLLGMDTRAQVK